jgi:hypothetical protein
MFNSDVILDVLGRSPVQPDFDAFLKAHRIYDRPHYPRSDLGEDDDEEPEFENARLSLVDEVERDSIALIYQERSNYERLFGGGSDVGDFVLKEVLSLLKESDTFVASRGRYLAGLHSQTIVNWCIASLAPLRRSEWFTNFQATSTSRKTGLSTSATSTGARRSPLCTPGAPTSLNAG